MYFGREWYAFLEADAVIQRLSIQSPHLFVRQATLLLLSFSPPKAFFTVTTVGISPQLLCTPVHKSIYQFLVQVNMIQDMCFLFPSLHFLSKPSIYLVYNLINSYLVATHFVLDTVLGAGDKKVNKTYSYT